MTISIFDLFKVGIGPSSSHTVGPMVAAKRFSDELAERAELNAAHTVRAEMFGSLGSTGKGHGTLKAVVLGLEGETPETIDIESIETRIQKIRKDNVISIASNHKIAMHIDKDIIFHKDKTLPFHPNGMHFICLNRNNETLLERYYYSVGGGFIVDEKRAKEDKLIIEEKVSLPYAFTSANKLLELCQQYKMKIADIMFENEKARHHSQDILDFLDMLWEVMKNCVERGCHAEGSLPGGLHIPRRAKKLKQKLLDNNLVGSDKIAFNDPLSVLDWVTLYALAVNEENASGGRIVTAPTNGAAGIIPAVLHYYIHFIEGADQQGGREFLLTAAAVGLLFKENASISGAEVGCQGEVGSACSMAAAGLTAVLNGSPEQIENAAEIAMEHHLGLTCDPIGGLVQIPCIERNAVASVKAIHAARIALVNEGSHFVSLDKVITTMRETGKDMLTKYKETSRGGLATHVVDVPVSIIEC